MDITSVECWANRDQLYTPNGVFGIDWTGEGWGRFEIVMDKDGVPHLYTECMCSQDNKKFAYDIMKKIIDMAIVEE